MNTTTTNHRPGARAVSTTVDHVETYRRVTLVERGPVWDDRIVYDSTTRPDLTRRARVATTVKQPHHRHVLIMWSLALMLFGLMTTAVGSGPEAYAVFAPVIQETFTHWSMS